MNFQRVGSIYSDIYFMVPPSSRMQRQIVPVDVSKQTSQFLDDLEEMYGIKKTTIHDGVAVIPVQGILSNDISRIDRLYGFVGYQQIADELVKAASDNSVRAVVLDFDSPGGQATGAYELANKILDFGKPVIAYTDTLCASAAFYLACGCQQILAAPSSLVGSVGTYMTIYDVSKYFNEFGISVEVLKSGEHKGAGEPGTSLTTDQRDQLQTIVDELGGQFRSFVQLRLMLATDQSLQGQAFTGTQAMQAGLINGFSDINGAIKLALDEADTIDSLNKPATS